MIQPAAAAPDPAIANASGTCSHCGADLLGAGLPGADGLRFCCEGCRVVHGILAGADGGVYYDLIGQSGARPPRAGITSSYRAYLENLRRPETLRSVGRWEGGNHSLTLECGDMQCAACGWLMERVLGAAPGVLDYDVDFIHGEMHVRYDAGKTTLPDLLEGVARYGYAFRPKAAGTVRPTLDRTAWMRLAVAAACFMNAMAFAFGPHIGLLRGMDDDWIRALGIWSFLSTLPAVFYSAWPFYQGAWRAVRARAFTIDVTVTIGIALTFAVSLAAAISDWRGGTFGNRIGVGHFNYSDSLAGLVFFLLLGRYAVRRFEGGLMLRSRWHEALSPDVVRRVDSGASEGFRLVPLDAIVPGDIVEVPAGDYLPVDGTVVSGNGTVDTAFLTGEERPRPFSTGDFLLAGYRVHGVAAAAALRVRVVNAHAATRAAGLRRALGSLVARKRARNIGRERVALGFTLFVAAAAWVALAVHWSSGWEKALVTAASVFIISCSCALALAVPVTRGVALLRAHRLGFHFREQDALERLADVRGILFDKTGTLTFTRREVRQWEWTGAVPGVDDARAGILAGLARITGMSAHPVAMAVNAALGDPVETPETERGRVEGFAEIPHFGLRGRWETPSGRRVELCLTRFGAWEGNDPAFREAGLVAPAGPDLARTEGEPPQSCLFVDGRLAAMIWLGEEVKPGVRELLAGLAEMGIETELLSGDHPDRVARFAEACGFARYRGGLSPEEKQAEARAFQARNGAALAVGDGFNDSLLFGEAAVSLAVQGSAGPVAAEADAFMTARDPAAVLSLLRIARGTRRSLFRSYIVSGVYNAGAISVAVAGLVTPLLAAILMPVSSLSLCLTAWLSIPRK